jgi:hypothetical protein
MRAEIVELRGAAADLPERPFRAAAERNICALEQLSDMVFSGLKGAAKMSKRSQPRKFVGAGVVVAAVTTGLAVYGAQVKQNREVVTNQQRAQKLRIEQARRTGGLKAAAAESNGRYVAPTVMGGDMPAGNLDVLLAESRLVFQGHVEDNRSRLTRGSDNRPDTETVVSHYQIRVQHVLHGDESARGRVITLEIPGGRYMFEDGSFADIELPDFQRPATNQELVVFARPKYGEGDVYTVAFGKQGIFGVRAGRLALLSHDRNDPIAREHGKKNLYEFEQEVRKAMERLEKARQGKQRH